MPEPPPTSLLTRYLLENPWPGVMVFLCVAVVAAVHAVRSDRVRGLQLAGAFLLCAIAVFLTERFVETSGEHGRRLALELVEAAENADVAAARALFATDATMALGSPNNPGYDVDWLRDQLDLLDDRYRIDTNRVTRLRAYTISGDAAVVHLSVMTTLESGFGQPMVSVWVLDVERRDESVWDIQKISCIRVNGRAPDLSWFR